MTISCPLCGEELELPDDVEIGRRILCPYCEEKFSLNVSVPADVVEESSKKTSSTAFTHEERDKAMEIFEQAQSEKTNPWKRKYKGSVWKKALELMLVFGVFIFIRDNVGKLFASKDYVAEAVINERNEIETHNKEHADRMKGYALDFVLQSENGRYPFLWAEKEQERVWNTLNVSIGYVEDHLKWLKDYQPRRQWNNQKAQARYDRFDGLRKEIFAKTIAFYESQQRLAYAIRKLFAAYYMTNSDSDISLKHKIVRLYPNGLSDIDAYHKEFALAASECNKEKAAFDSFLRTFKWDFK